MNHISTSTIHFPPLNLRSQCDHADDDDDNDRQCKWPSCFRNCHADRPHSHRMRKLPRSSFAHPSTSFSVINFPFTIFPNPSRPTRFTCSGPSTERRNVQEWVMVGVKNAVTTVRAGRSFLLIKQKIIQHNRSPPPSLTHLFLPTRWSCSCAAGPTHLGSDGGQSVRMVSGNRRRTTTFWTPVVIRCQQAESKGMSPPEFGTATYRKMGAYSFMTCLSVQWPPVVSAFLQLGKFMENRSNNKLGWNFRFLIYLTWLNTLVRLIAWRHLCGRNWGSSVATLALFNFLGAAIREA